MHSDGAESHGYVVDGSRHLPNEELIVDDPATNEPIAVVPEAGSDGVDHALDAAVSVSDDWAAFDPVERGRILRGIATGIRENVDRLAEIESREMGRPLGESRENVHGAASYFEYYAGVTDKIEGRQIPLANDGDYLDYTLREPYGVTAQIVPWNAALALAGRGFAPALATGNVIVAKAPEKAPLSLLELAEIATDAGLPDGVLNVVTGTGAITGEALIGDDRVTAVEFTGSTETGRTVMQSAAEPVAEIHLELGGNGAHIVFGDADLSAALDALVATFKNSGQICFAPKRIFVQSDVYDAFRQRAVDRVAELTVGPGLVDPDVGPLITPEARDDVAGTVQDAREAGGEILIGGEVPALPGNYYAPTVIDDVPDSASVCCEEVFGPVLTLHEFETLPEAVNRVNETQYGLSNVVWTSDLSRAHSVADQLASGTVMINDYPVLSPAAVSGGFKQSGIGRAKGMQALEAFTQTKNVIVSLDRS